MSLTKVSFSLVAGAPISIIDFGADPTGTNDSTIALKNAIAAAQASNGYVYIPIGTFKITDRILVNPAISIQGQDQDKSILKFSAVLGTSAADALIEMYNGTYFSVRNFCLDGNARGGTTNGYGLQIYWCEDFEVSDVKFYDVMKGNIGLTEHSSVSLCKRVKLLRNRIVALANNAQEGIGIAGVEQCLIDGNIIDNPIDDSIALHGPGAVELLKDTCEDVIISNNIIGNNLYFSPAISGSGRLLLEGQCKNILITGNSFYGDNYSAYVALATQNVTTSPLTPWSEGYPSNINIVGNNFYCANNSTAQPTGILISVGAQINISNNKFVNFTTSINVTVQPSGYLQNTNSIDINSNTFTGSPQGVGKGISIGSYDFPVSYPTELQIRNNFYGQNLQVPIYFDVAIDGAAANISFAGNIQSGATAKKPPSFNSGDPKYLDFNNNSWNYVNGIPISYSWAKGSVQWTGIGATSGQPIGWVCTVAGTPGTWKTFGAIAA